MKVWVPGVALHPVIKKLLEPGGLSRLGFDYEFYQIDQERGEDYPDYFQARWEEGVSFLNYEHDMVPWPGAIEQIMECSEPWCYYNYPPRTHHIPGVTFLSTSWVPGLGLIKISDQFIAATTRMWDAETWPKTSNSFLRDWKWCDQHLAHRAVEHGFKGHEHKPPVVNLHFGLYRFPLHDKVPTE